MILIYPRAYDAHTTRRGAGVNRRRRRRSHSSDENVEPETEIRNIVVAHSERDAQRESEMDT
jgi:hypothetical protein